MLPEPRVTLLHWSRETGGFQMLSSHQSGLIGSPLRAAELLFSNAVVPPAEAARAVRPAVRPGALLLVAAINTAGATGRLAVVAPAVPPSVPGKIQPTVCASSTAALPSLIGVSEIALLLLRFSAADSSTASARQGALDGLASAAKIVLGASSVASGWTVAGAGSPKMLAKAWAQAIVKTSILNSQHIRLRSKLDVS